jgi:hypothetical protein
MLALDGRARRGVHVVMTFAALATAAVAVAGTAAPVAGVIHGRTAHGLLYLTAVRDGI